MPPPAGGRRQERTRKDKKDNPAIAEKIYKIDEISARRARRFWIDAIFLRGDFMLYR